MRVTILRLGVIDRMHFLHPEDSEITYLEEVPVTVNFTPVQIGKATDFKVEDGLLTAEITLNREYPDSFIYRPAGYGNVSHLEGDHEVVDELDISQIGQFPKIYDIYEDESD